MQENGRIGEQIRMSNIDVVLQSSVMFNAESVPLHDEQYVAWRCMQTLSMWKLLPCASN